MKYRIVKVASGSYRVQYLDEGQRDNIDPGFFIAQKTWRFSNDLEYAKYELAVHSIINQQYMDAKHDERNRVLEVIKEFE